MFTHRQRIRFVLLGCLFLLTTAVGCQPVESADKAYPDPGRFEQAIMKFEKMDAASPAPVGAVVCVGSSSMRMWHDRIGQDLEPLTIIARGFGGSNMNDLLVYVDRVVIAYRPRAVVIYEGDNDIAQGVSPAMIARTFDDVVDRIHATLPDCRVYVLAIKPSPARWELWPMMQEANRLLKRSCSTDKRLTFIDVAGPMLGDDGRPRPELYVEDRLHMTRAGYEVWREAVRPVLVEAERGFEP